CNTVTNCTTLTALAEVTAKPLLSLTNSPDTSATFRTAANGSGPLRYQWTKNGAPINGATTNSYTIPSVTLIDAGTYCVIVSGPSSAVTNCATLTVQGN